MPAVFAAQQHVSIKLTLSNKMRYVMTPFPLKKTVLFPSMFIATSGASYLFVFLFYFILVKTVA